MGAQKATSSGGEPFLKEGFEQIIIHMHKIGLEYGIVTNGSAIGATVLNTMVNHKPLIVGFSLDGLGSTHNYIRQNSQSYRSVLKSVSMVKAGGIPTAAITTISKLNIGELGHLMDLVAFIGFDCWQIQLSMPFGRMKEHIDWLIDQDEFWSVCQQIICFRKRFPHIKIEAADCFGPAPGNVIRDEEQYGCGAGITGVGIDACGNVLPCLSLRGSDVCGNIREQSLREIWENSSGFDFNRNFQPDNIGSNCSNCQIINGCRGGCASNSVAYTGQLHNSPFCFLRSFHSN